MKKILILVIGCLLSVNTFAQTGSCGDNVTWAFESGVLTISGSGEMDNYGYYGTTPWSSYKGDVTSVVIQEGVTTIGNSAFFNCKGLTTLTIPHSVTTIGYYAFYKCTGLTHITLGDGISLIGNEAFYGCTSLTTLTLGEGVTTIGKMAFYNCFALTSLTIPNSVTTIEEGAFYYCSSLESVTIGDGVTTIGNTAFKNCIGITSLTMGNRVADIWDGAFTYCTGLTSVTIPKSVTWLGYYAFSDCTALTEMISLNPTPPTARFFSFDGINKSSCVLIVPVGSVAAYKAAAQWNEFKNIIEGQPDEPDVITSMTCSVSDTYESLTIGSLYSVHFVGEGVVDSNTRFKVQFSDKAGSFDNYVEVDGILPEYAHVNTEKKTFSGFLRFQVPDNLYEGSQYRIRVRAIGPDYISSDNGRDLVIANAIQVKEAYIKTLEPNINPDRAIVVKELATVYHYYRVVDENDVPLPDAVISFTVNGRTYYSEKSKEDGVVAVPIKVWGDDPDDSKDDDIPHRTTGSVLFQGLTVQGQEVNVPDTNNAFRGSFTITVEQYERDNSEMRLEIGGKVTGEALSLIKIKPSLGLDIYLSDTYTHGKVDVRTLGIKGGGEMAINVGGDLLKDVSIPVLLLELEAGGEAGGAIYGTAESIIDGVSSYLKILHEALSYSYISTGRTDKWVHAMITMIGNWFKNTEDPKSNAEWGYGYSLSSSGALNIGVKVGEKKKAKLGGNAQGDLNVTIGNGVHYTTTSENRYHSYEYEVETDISLGGNYEKMVDKKSEKYGGDLGETLLSSVKYEWTEYPPFYSQNTQKGSFSITKSGDMNDLEVDWKVVGGKIIKQKKYTYEYNMATPIFNYIDANPLSVSTINSFWNFYVNNTQKPVDNVLPFILEDNNAEKHLNAVTDFMGGIDYEKHPNMGTSFTHNLSKTYAGGVELKQAIGIPSTFLGFGWSTKIEGAGILEGEYPLLSSVWHPEIGWAPTIKFEDVDKPWFYFSPYESIDNVIYDLTQALKNGANVVKDAAKNFWGNVVEFFEPGNQFDIILSNAMSHFYVRGYSKNLKNYNTFLRSNQTDISILEFTLPGGNKSFQDNTEVRLDYYYPGGELLGETVDQDTILVVSDLFILQATLGNDTLSIAPLGDFSVKATLGLDDLSALGIDTTYPVSVYYSDFEGAWERIGAVGEPIATNRLGSYCLGVSVNEDKEAPLIAIHNEPYEIEVLITDNMAVYWKGVSVLVNGVLSEWEKDNNTLRVYLSDEQVKDDLYVTVYATDLARNQSVETALFKSPVDMASPAGDKGCKLYPNPAVSSCQLDIPSDLLIGDIQYALVSPLGQVYEQGEVRDCTTMIDVSHLTPGVYFVVVYDDKLIYQQKLIKK